MVNHILNRNAENFILENADFTGDGDVTVLDVTSLVDLILANSGIVNAVVNGAEGLTFGGSGTEAGPGL